MPWNDSSNNGDKPTPPKGPKPSPWGDPPSGGSGGNSGGESGGPSEPTLRPTRRPTGGGGMPPPDFNDLARRFGRQFGGILGGLGGGAGGGGGGVGMNVFGLVGAAIVALWLASGVYVVAANEQAVIQTFGAYYGLAGPGLHYRAPWPIQQVTRVGTSNIRGLNVGGTQSAHTEDESLMLTGDKDIVDVQYTVQWRVVKPQDYLFNLKDLGPDSDTAIKAVAESSMREVVGRNALQPIITTARGQIQSQVADLMQRILDSYGAGVSIEEVQISGAQPPPAVMDAFRDVQSAQQDAEALANQARGRASQVTQAAVGDKALAIQGAEGEAAAFNQVYAQYKLAPAVTRQRLYIETMERVLQNSQKIIVDNKGASAPIILPPDAFRPRPVAPAPAAAQAQAPAATSRGQR